MAYTDAEIDAKIAQAVMDTLTFVGTQYVKQDGSTPITGEQRIEKVNTDELKNNDTLYINAQVIESNAQDITLLATNMVNVSSKLGMRNGTKTLTLDASGITHDHTQILPDSDGTIDVNP